MATKKTIKSTDKVRVHKNMSGSISYKLGGVTKFWEENTQYKDFSISDIQELMGNYDVSKMLDKNALLIKDEDMRNYLQLNELNENYLDTEKIKELLKTGDANKVEKVIETCEDTELEMIVETAVNEKITDRNILGVIEDYTNLDLTEDILNNVDTPEEKEDKTVKRTKKK